MANIIGSFRGVLSLPMRGEIRTPSSVSSQDLELPTDGFKPAAPRHPTAPSAAITPVPANFPANSLTQSAAVCPPGAWAAQFLTSSGEAQVKPPLTDAQKMAYTVDLDELASSGRLLAQDPNFADPVHCNHEFALKQMQAGETVFYQSPGHREPIEIRDWNHLGELAQTSRQGIIG